MTETADPNVENTQESLSLGTRAARNLATTTKSVPQMQGITSRWLLRVLPWVETRGGVYRVNRRVTYTVGDGRVTFINTGADVRVIPEELRELPALRTFDDSEVLGELAQRFEQREYQPGDVIVESGRPVDRVHLLAHGKVHKIGTGEYDDGVVVGTLIDGDHFGAHALVESEGTWDYTVRAVTRTTVLALSRRSFDELADRSQELRAHVEAYRASPPRRQNKYGEAAISVASGHEGEPDISGTFVDYELSPREYELSVAQTVLRVHSRVADLYNEPMDQVEQQVRLTIEALRERQEHEMLNNRDFGLLHNADLRQRVPTRTGPPTPTTSTNSSAAAGGRSTSWRTREPSPRSAASATRGASTRTTPT